MNVKIIIARLKRKWFPTEEDKVWKEWVDHKQRENKDLVELLTSDVREGFKKRALFLLLVPSAEFNPIYWPKEVGKFYHGSDFLKTLTPGLLAYATSLIIQFYTTLRPLHCDRPKHYAEGGGGITIYISVPDQYHDALYFYNDCILSLLTLLTEEKCERIFPLFSLLDISTYWNLDTCSGYNPFQSLLYSNINEKWKRKADDAMRQIIQDELAGKTKPREEYEDALNCYASIIQLQLYSEKLSYSVDMLADQIQFLVAKEHYGKKVIDGWHVGKILKILSADTYKEIRYQIAKFVVFGNKEEFSVWSEEILQGANMMLSEFGQSDEKLADKIKSAIEKHNEQTVKSKKQQANTVDAEEGILNKMK